MQIQTKLSSGPPAGLTCVSPPAVAGGRTAVILGLWLSVAIPEGTLDHAFLGLGCFPLFYYPLVTWALVSLPRLSSALSPQLFFPVDAPRSVDDVMLRYRLILLHMCTYWEEITHRCGNLK